MIFDIFHVNGIFHTRLDGEPDASSLEAYYEKLTSHKEWNNSSKILSDETSMSYQKIKSADMQKLARITTSFKNKFKNSSIAVYVNSEYNFGMARMWQSYVDTELNAKVCIFRSYEAANSWLKEQL